MMAGSPRVLSGSQVAKSCRFLAPSPSHSRHNVDRQSLPEGREFGDGFGQPGEVGVGVGGVHRRRPMSGQLHPHVLTDTRIRDVVRSFCAGDTGNLRTFTKTSPAKATSPCLCPVPPDRCIAQSGRPSRAGFRREPSPACRPKRRASCLPPDAGPPTQCGCRWHSPPPSRAR